MNELIKEKELFYKMTDLKEKLNNSKKYDKYELLNELKVTFEDKTVTYDGNEHSVVIEGELPTGVTVSSVAGVPASFKF